MGGMMRAAVLHAPVPPDAFVIEEVPKTAQAIYDRINTLSFNSSMMREMRAISFVTRLVDSGFDDNGRLKKMLIHCIDAEEHMRNLGVSSKLNASWDFLTHLHELGRDHGSELRRLHRDGFERHCQELFPCVGRA